MASNISFGVISGKNENTLALANFNLDFSIVKYAAPPEFRGLGLSLSPNRRKEAEDGLSHTVARKLALLFCQDLPEIPNLIKAYGTRATKIAENPLINPKGTHLDGAFQDHVGVDGTSLWASATSGKGVVALHLLTCMISRMWKRRATAIWAEMVAKRKAELQRRLQGDVFSSDELTASAIQLSREQLASWDASAKAWLESADTAFSRKQTQLMLILDNLGISLPAGPNVDKVITDAWKAALRFMENAVVGIPQTLNSGEVLLALSAWHLYPDLEVLHGHARVIKQNDPLITPGGIVTIGLQNPSVDDDLGISWSLPLSHLQYYGKPVLSTGFVNTRSSRISMNQLQLVSLGCITSSWVKRVQDTTLCAEFFLALQKVLESLGQNMPIWLKPVFSASEFYLKTDGEARMEAERLISFGRRRCPEFLSNSLQQIPSAFNFGKPEVFVGLLKDSDAKIRFLRTSFQNEKEHPKPGNPTLAQLSQGLIRYRPSQHEVAGLVLGSGETGSKSTLTDHHRHPNHPDAVYTTYSTPESEWASLAANYQDGDSHPKHRRWLPALNKDWEASVYDGAKFTSVASVAVKRCSHLESKTREACSLILGGHVSAITSNKLSSNDDLGHKFRLENWLEDGLERKLDGFTDRDAYNKYDTWILWRQSHTMSPTSSILRGYQIPDHPASDSRTVPAGFGVWGSQSEVRSIKSNGGAQTITKSTEQVISLAAIRSQSDAWSVMGFRLLGSIVDTIVPAARHPDLPKQIELMSRIISSEISSNPSLQHLQDLQLSQSPTSITSPGNLATENAVNLCSAAQVRIKGDDSRPAASWSCRGSKSDCVLKSYLPLPKYHSTDVQFYCRVFVGWDDVDIYLPFEELPNGPPIDFTIPVLPLQEITKALQDDTLDASMVLRFLTRKETITECLGGIDNYSSLSALNFASEVYSNIPDARVELATTSIPMHTFHWSNDLDIGQRLDHARSLSCIASFESGYLNIRPAELREVMGISAGNSLYIAQFLWSDPFLPPPSNVIRRSIGNVGKQGIAFLISPLNPLIRDPGYDNWQNVQHEEFDGSFENNFPETSLHLSFTGYEQALNTGQHGLLDNEVYFLQAVVQAYEKGNWVADLDILSALNADPSPDSGIVSLLPDCKHTGEVVGDFSYLDQLTSIDSWAELIDQPSSAAIVRANGNWLARLAATVVAFQKGRRVFVALDRVCWKCVKDTSCNPSTLLIVC
ncbi:hypothetical protein BP6252_12137 [Coleophoma cylindrospora]|uniref:Uncharacterized protein n=1 Tax=Coleophoma cylindrospora TaxID=1849047 RepID=A0A3D8QH57_9HELO|nr:hypothetical protein BP6252_12137 [Coleophoma cylindrospora]